LAENEGTRPTFFEGQYLGSDDLGRAQEYQRGHSRRHALGGHDWGVAAGLAVVGAALLFLWSKRYRAWETNRNVLLHPEDWTEPELQKEKKPRFRQDNDQGRA
jgi:hypothetical protein